MRDILFRGKRKDDGTWEVGNYSNYLHSDGHVTYYINGFEYEVHPETIGQYTGLMDKNGRRIFEGDIVKETFEGTTIEYEGDWSEFREEVDFYGNKIGAVTFTGTGTHLKATQGELWVNGEAVEDWKPSRRTRLSARRCEVIGNIHDNPELLKGDS